MEEAALARTVSLNTSCSHSVLQSPHSDQRYLYCRNSVSGSLLWRSGQADIGRMLSSLHWFIVETVFLHVLIASGKVVAWS